VNYYFSAADAQYNAPGFLKNVRQMRQFGFAAIELAQVCMHSDQLVTIRCPQRVPWRVLSTRVVLLQTLRQLWTSSQGLSVPNKASTSPALRDDGVCVPMEGAGCLSDEGLMWVHPRSALWYLRRPVLARCVRRW
jgi:hypothetical protein